MSGLTTAAVVDTNVHGIVVHTSRSVPDSGPVSNGNLT